MELILGSNLNKSDPKSATTVCTNCDWTSCEALAQIFKMNSSHAVLFSFTLWKNVLGYPLALVYTFKQRQGSTWDIMMNHISVHVSREFTLYLLLVQIAWYVFCTLRTPNSSCLSPFGVMQPEYNRNLDLNVCPFVKKKNTKKRKSLNLSIELVVSLIVVSLQFLLVDCYVATGILNPTLVLSNCKANKHLSCKK